MLAANHRRTKGLVSFLCNKTIDLCLGGGDRRPCSPALPRGRHSVSCRMRAEIPGQFSALPTRVYAMYAPELKGNSDEIKLKIVDVPDEK